MKITTLAHLEEPKISQTPLAAKKLEVFLEKSDKEEFMILGVQHQDSDPPNHLIIKDWVLPEQNVHGTNCKCVDGFIDKLEEDYNNGLQSSDYKEEKQTFIWCHSHVNGTVAPSAQDNVESLEYGGILYKMVYTIIVNKRGTNGVTLYDFNRNLKISDLDMNIYLGDVDIQALEQLYEKNVHIIQDITTSNTKTATNINRNGYTYYSKTNPNKTNKAIYDANKELEKAEKIINDVCKDPFYTNDNGFLDSSEFDLGVYP
jgi:hypothetical protein